MRLSWLLGWRSTILLSSIPTGTSTATTTPPMSPRRMSITVMVGILMTSISTTFLVATTWTLRMFSAPLGTSTIRWWSTLLSSSSTINHTPIPWSRSWMWWTSTSSSWRIISVLTVTSPKKDYIHISQYQCPFWLQWKHSSSSAAVRFLPPPRLSTNSTFSF